MQDWKKIGAVTISVGSFFAVLVGAPLLVAMHSADSRLQLRLELKSDIAGVGIEAKTLSQHNQKLFLQAQRSSEKFVQRELHLLLQEVTKNRDAIEVNQSLLFDEKLPTRRDRDHQGEF